MDFGQKLKETRNMKGYSLDYIEEETKIRKLYINALEQENFKILPPKVYATGFVRRYSKFLDLDSDAMVEEFQSLAYADEPLIEEPELKKREVKVDFHIPYRNILAGIVFLIIAIWAGKFVLGYINQQARVPEPQGPTPPRVEEPVKGNRPDKPEPEIKPEKAVLLIQARQDCWLTVAVDGESVFTRTLKAGESQEFEGKESIYIKAGNAGGIDITYNGKKVEPIGRNWEVKEKEFRVKS
ncbi:helix-turn-helix domain-containing protein [Syntrophomonas curvata]